MCRELLGVRWRASRRYARGQFLQAPCLSDLIHDRLRPCVDLGGCQRGAQRPGWWGVCNVARAHGCLMAGSGVSNWFRGELLAILGGVFMGGGGVGGSHDA